MLADAESVDSQIVGKDRLFDDVAQHACLRQETAVGIDRHVSEGIQAELEIVCHTIDSTSPAAG